LAAGDESDRKLLQNAFCHASRVELAGMIKDGEDAISDLAGTGNYANRQQFPFPDLCY